MPALSNTERYPIFIESRLCLSRYERLTIWKADVGAVNSKASAAVHAQGLTRQQAISWLKNHFALMSLAVSHTWMNLPPGYIRESNKNPSNNVLRANAALLYTSIVILP